MITRYYLIFLCYLFSTSALAAGWIDSASHNHYVGWACQKGNDAPVGIHIWRDDGIFLGGGNASKHREQAVATACGTNSANHGFDIKLTIPSNLIDHKRHQVNIHLVTETGSELLENSPLTVEFGTLDPNLEKPTTPGTVVGRDLAVGDKLAELRAGIVGHIGIWDGRKVIEMLNEGGSNKVKISTWEDFISRTSVWPKAVPKFPSSGRPFQPSSYEIKGCFAVQCLAPGSEPPNELVPDGGYTTFDPRAAIVARANQIYLIGSKYTLSAFPGKAIPGRVSWTSAYCNPFSKNGPCPLKRVINPIPGTYRCDTFVLDAYATSALADWGASIDARYTVNNQEEHKAWHSRMNILATFTTRFPYAIMHALRTIQ